MSEDTLITGKEARKKLLKGVNKVANAVKNTLGANATTVIIEQEDSFPLILNDGVSIAQAVNDPDPYVQMGIDLIKQVATQAQNSSGDGTTTATVIAQSLCNEGMDMISAGDDPVEVVDTLKADAEKIITGLKENSTECEALANLIDVATISANNDSELGSLIAEVMHEIGSEGAIAMKNGSSYETYYEITEGLDIQAGSASPYFTESINNANVLISMDKINTFESIVPAMEASLQEGRGLLIVCSDYNPAILPNLLINVVQGKINATLVKMAGMRDTQWAWAEDIQAVTGGEIYATTKGNPLKGDLSMGYADTVVCKKDSCVIESKVNAVDSNIERLQELMESAESSWDKQVYARRIARLQRGVASIIVGADSEVELRERKERIDDAVNAVRAAQRNGIIAGGGSLLYALSKDSDNPLIVEAFTTPLNLIAAYCDVFVEPEMVDGEFNGIGYNAKTNEWCNMIEAGVIDPVDVVVNSIRSAISIATLVLLSEAMVALPRD